MSKINTAIFDVGGVLADYNTVSYYIHLGYSQEKAQRLAEATMFTKDWEEYDRGVLTDEEIRARFKKNAPDLSHDIDSSLSCMHGVVTRRDAAVPWIRSVRERNVKTYVLSNFSYTVKRDNPEALDFIDLMNDCFWSMEHKVIKPDDACFLTMFYEFHIDPERAVFIDDTEKNLKAASLFGMRTVLYRNQQQAEDELNQILEKE